MPPCLSVCMHADLSIYPFETCLSLNLFSFICLSAKAPSPPPSFFSTLHFHSLFPTLFKSQLFPTPFLSISFPPPPPTFTIFVSIKTNTPTSLDSLYFPSPWVLLLAPFLSSAGILYEFFTDWEGLESDHFAGKFARCIYMPQVLRNLCVQHIIIRLIKYTHILRLTGIIKKKMIAFVRVKRSFWFLCESKQKQ